MRTVLRVLRPVLLAGSIVYLAYVLWDVPSVLGSIRDLRPEPLVGAFVLLLAALAGTASLWIGLVRYRSESPPHADTVQLLRAFSRSWIARYLPGSAWSQAARWVHTDPALVARSSLAHSLVDELVLAIGTAAALGLAAWALSEWGVVAASLVLLALGSLTVAFAAHVPRLAGTTLRMLRVVTGGRPPLPPEPGRSQRVRRAAPLSWFTAGYLLVNAAGGLSFVLVASLVVTFPPNAIPPLMAGYALAFVVGLVAFFAPAGLGVREAVLTSLTAAALTAPAAALAAVILRAVGIIVDLVFFLCVELLTVGRRSRRAREDLREPGPGQST
ncbi:MAG: hypothetical protein ACRDH8_07350 [Actinomycetota bacterium]